MDSSSSLWQKMAIVEVSPDVVSLADLVGRDSALNFRFEPVRESSMNSSQYELFVDMRDGERRRARTAWAILTALKNTADANLLPGFRIIDGSQWLTLGAPEVDIKTGDLAVGDISANPRGQNETFF